ncbi:GDSL-type esterase/lipase family protein [Ideonella sp. BN130291]|uniref:GDSL-type esterase/lipase family protein n=1 Tax=Ideonella sp. BN130291 TaxID=3112940 RepID=UPI002E276076|nr:GDSL-type esterase/lipase family protein [Ideonella sp. BN130291]
MPSPQPTSPARRPARWRQALWFAALLVAGCGGGGSAQADAPPATGAHAWVVVGSSTAAGAGATAGQGWVALMAAEEAPRGVVVHNLARPSLTSYHVLSAGSQPPPGRPAPDPSADVDAALALHPQALFVSLPTNDTAMGYSVSETVTNLLAIRSQALQAGVPVVMLSTQPRDLPPDRLALLPQIDQQLADAAGPCFVPVRAQLAGPDGRIDPRYDVGDGVHLNDAGHQVVWQQVRAVLQSHACIASG